MYIYLYINKNKQIKVIIFIFYNFFIKNCNYINYIMIKYL